MAPNVYLWVNLHLFHLLVALMKFLILLERQRQKVSERVSSFVNLTDRLVDDTKILSNNKL